MRPGDTIVQQVYLPPFPLLSIKMIFGVRIREIFDTPERKGFSYETLCGHAEKGISTFIIERRGGKVYFTIHTFSEPGTTLARIAAPFFSLPYQAYCTRKALNEVRRKLMVRSAPHQ